MKIILIIVFSLLFLVGSLLIFAGVFGEGKADLKDLLRYRKIGMIFLFLSIVLMIAYFIKYYVLPD